MTPDSDSEHPERSAGDPSVFGNLPSARPGVRSPRRDSGKAGPGGSRGTPRKASKASAATPKASPPPPRRPEPRSTPPPTRSGAAQPSAAPPEHQESSSRGIEDVAWAGITVAAEAATLGVRLFSRALGAVRERR